MRDWVLVVPVKRLTVAKSRLADFAGPDRSRLALAFATDTLLAAAACERVRGIAVVTDDDEVVDALETLEKAAGLRVLVVGDEPDAGLNPALVHGAAKALAHWPDARVAALSSDLPALRARELTEALDAADGHAAGFVADSAGTGTTLLTASTLTAFAPRFGSGSAAAHEAGGAVRLDGAETGAVPSLRRDVDTEADLTEAGLLGLGPRSASVLAGLLLGPAH